MFAQNNNFMNMNNMNSNNFQFINNFNPQMNQSPMINNMNGGNMIMNNNQSNQNNQNNSNNKDLKLNKIIGIESMIPINNCKHKYNNKEYDEITQACITAIKQKEEIKIKNISEFCVEKIKEKLKGQWFVLVQDINEQNLEFGFSLIKNKDILSFRYSNNIFYVSRLG